MQHFVIVDDQEISLRFLRNTLADLVDVVVHPFSSSADALAWVEGNEVDCFVIDYHLPPPNGLELVRLLRAMPAFADVPMVILTGEHEREVRYRAFDAGATDFMEKPFDRRELLARLSTMLSLRAAQKRLRMQVGWLEASLVDSEARSREQADRLEALWRVANDPAIGDDELIPTMLKRAVHSIRRDQSFVGLLGRVEGAEIVTEAVAGDAGAAVADAVGVGVRRPLEQSVAAHSIRRGRTASWDDLEADPLAPRDPYGLGWRAVLSTHFAVGSDVYALTFASPQPAQMAFRAQDHAYVEILAEFFASRIQQRWQAAKIRFQLEHDSLTGLLNRSRFRSLARSALSAGRPAAVAVFDLIDFHAINESRGHLIGDAILVEAAAGLAAATSEEEILARIGGDSFAVCFPVVASEEMLGRRIAQLGAVFDRPLATGDRTGTEALHAAAAVGVAMSPHDGTTLDELLLRAESRTAGGGSERLR